MPDPAGLAEIVPAPKHIETLEGTTELSDNARLATSNVLPFIRKTMRAVLTNAGVRVVANKKRFVITVNIVEEDQVNLQDVPVECRNDYYELEIKNNFITITTPFQLGSVWGLQTFVDLYAKLGCGAEIPNVRIRDWADMPYRGFFLDAAWGVERMKEVDWGAFFDRLTATRVNFFGLNLCGCPHPDHPHLSSQSAMIPPPPEEEEPEGDLLKEQTWFFQRKKRVVTESYYPSYQERNFFSQVIELGKEKGLHFALGVSLSKALFSVLQIRYAKKNKEDFEAGTVTPDELSNEKLREHFASLIQDLQENYSTGDNPFFFFDLNDAENCSDPSAVVDFVDWAIDMMQEKGIGGVVLRSKALSSCEGNFADAFSDLLEAKSEHVTLQSPWECAKSRATQTVPCPEWIGGIKVENLWSHYEDSLDEMIAALTYIRENNKQGFVSDTASDAVFLDHEHLLTHFAWNFNNVDLSIEPAHDKCLETAFPSDAETVKQARLAVKNLSEESPSLKKCSWFNYTDDGAYTLNYPALLIEELEKIGLETVRSEMERVNPIVEEYVAKLEPMKPTEEEPRDYRYPHYTFVANLHAEFLRYRCYANAVLKLIDLREAEHNGTLKKCTAKEFNAAKSALTNDFVAIAKYKKTYTVAPFVQCITPLLQFLNEIPAQLKQIKSGDTTSIDWNIKQLTEASS